MDHTISGKLHENVEVIWDTPANDVNYVRPWLYDKQLEGIFNTARYAVIEASTKSGKTVGCIVWIVEKALIEGRVGRNYWWIAPVSDQSDIAFRRVKLALPEGSFTAKENPKRITLFNGAMIWFKSADNPDSLYGEDVYGAVVDEATRCKDDSWYAIRSTLTATRGQIRVIGNVKGRTNWMYRLARLAQQGDQPDMHYVKITAYDAAAAGVIEYEEIENAKLIYPENAFRELYLAEAGDDGGNPFGITHIQKCIGPLSNEEPFVWGWDVAKYTNFTVGIALSENGKTCRFHRFQDTWDATVQRMTTLTGGKAAMIDSTGSGDQLLERLRLDGHTNFQGYQFGGWKSKQDLMVGLVLAIQQGEITFPEGPIVEELEAFEYEVVNNVQGDIVRYTSPKGVHDDCVDALAMAVKLWKRKSTVHTGISPIVLHKSPSWVIA